MPRATTQPEVLILGGGLAGASAAILLARAGCPVTITEREAAPRHKVCGEFLSGEALHLLRHLGIDPVAHGAPGIRSVRLASARGVVEAPLPFPARSLTRRCLDGLLLEAAEAAGAVVLRGRTVEALAPGNHRWQITLDRGGTLSAPRALLATGKHDLRGFLRPEGPQGDLVALKMYLQLRGREQAALSGAVELLLHPHGYAGLQLMEDGSANLCGLVRRGHLTRLGGWAGLLAELQATNPHAARRLRDAVPLLPKPLAVSALPYGFVRRRALGAGLYAVGDQAAVIPSFTGDGMSLALYTGVLAAQSLLAGETAEQFQEGAYRALHPQVRRATNLSRMLVHPVGKPLLTAAAQLWPGLLTFVAGRTRLAPAREAGWESFPERLPPERNGHPSRP